MAISIDEEKNFALSPRTITQWIITDSLIGKTLTQESFDNYLQEHLRVFGSSNASALSKDHSFATLKTNSLTSLFGKCVIKGNPKAPCLSLSIPNKGWHAYINPVLSDFSEFMPAAKDNNITDISAV